MSRNRETRRQIRALYDCHEDMSLTPPRQEGIRCILKNVLAIESV